MKKKSITSKKNICKNSYDYLKKKSEFTNCIPQKVKNNIGKLNENGELYFEKSKACINSMKDLQNMKIKVAITGRDGITHVIKRHPKLKEISFVKNDPVIKEHPTETIPKDMRLENLPFDKIHNKWIDKFNSKPNREKQSIEKKAHENVIKDIINKNRHKNPYLLNIYFTIDYREKLVKEKKRIYTDDIDSFIAKLNIRLSIRFKNYRRIEVYNSHGRKINNIIRTSPEYLKAMHHNNIFRQPNDKIVISNNFQFDYYNKIKKRENYLLKIEIEENGKVKLITKEYFRYRIDLATKLSVRLSVHYGEKFKKIEILDSENKAIKQYFYINLKSIKNLFLNILETKPSECKGKDYYDLLNRRHLQLDYYTKLIA